MTVFILCVLLIGPVWGQLDGGKHSVQSFLLPNSTVNIASFENFLSKLENKRGSFSTEQDFLFYTFQKVHHSYLKRFQEYSPFEAVFTNGSYNCLTGTVLLSIVFDELNIEYDAIETNYHIFLKAKTKDGDILIETTDPENGFVTNAEEIKNRIRSYIENNPVLNDQRVAYQFSFDLYNKVSLSELQGLLYYNMAVESFNRQSLTEATNFLEKTVELYTSPRVEELSTILLIAVSQNDFNIEEKAKLKKALQIIRYKAMPAMASLSSLSY